MSDSEDPCSSYSCLFSKRLCSAAQHEVLTFVARFFFSNLRRVKRFVSKFFSNCAMVPLLSIDVSMLCSSILLENQTLPFKDQTNETIS